MKKLPNTLSFVDVETTGTNPKSDRVIEIGIVRVEKGEIVGKLNSLVNPRDAYISPFISNMTGISPAELSSAPYFEEIKTDVLDLLNDSIFVAHSANFDYGFVKHELSRLDARFKSKIMCTVRLSGYLFPEHRKHNLDILKSRFDLKIDNRHRAYDDAHALWQFYKKVQDVSKRDTFFDAVKAQLSSPIPKNIKRQDVDNLPESPGVYIFYGEVATSGQQSGDEVVLYVGKSVNIKKRVMNHFTSAKFSQKEDKMFNQITRIEIIPTHGELGALIRESENIKSLSPIFNKVLRRKSEMLVLMREETNGYFKARLEKQADLNEDNMTKILAVYKSKANAQEQLRDLSKEYKLCPILLDLEKNKGRCFNYQLELCNGACVGEEDPLQHNLRFLEAFSSSLVPEWPFEGEILIKEESLDGYEIHKIDNWIYKGSVLFTKEGLENKGLDGSVFDWDVYKIIKRAVRRNMFFDNKKGLELF